MQKKTTCSSKTDIYTKITDEIISAIETGAADFEMPWHKQAHAGLPRNPLTKKPYQGINALTLWVVGWKQGFASSYWATYKQWKELGAQVRQGESGATVLFYKREEVEAETEETEDRSRVVLRYSYVFNADQVDSWTVTEIAPEANHIKYAKTVSFINALGSDIKHGSDTAYYSPSLDCIFMPDQ